MSARPVLTVQPLDEETGLGAWASADVTALVGSLRSMEPVRHALPALAMHLLAPSGHPGK